MAAAADAAVSAAPLAARSVRSSAQPAASVAEWPKCRSNHEAISRSTAAIALQVGRRTANIRSDKQEGPDVDRALRIFTPSLTRAARFTGTVPINDPCLGEVVGRHFEVDAIAHENLDSVPTQAPRDMREDGMTVLQFHCKRCAWKYLRDGAEDFQRGFFNLGWLRHPGGLGPSAPAARYDGPTFWLFIPLLYTMAVNFCAHRHLKGMAS